MEKIIFTVDDTTKIVILALLHAAGCNYTSSVVAKGGIFAPSRVRYEVTGRRENLVRLQEALKMLP